MDGQRSHAVTGEARVRVVIGPAGAGSTELVKEIISDGIAVSSGGGGKTWA